MIFNLLADEASKTSPWFTYIILGVLVVAFIVMSVVNSKQRKKQAQKDQERKDSMCIGTKVITIGGIMGEVVEILNDENAFILETEGNKIKFDKRAIYQMTLPGEIDNKENTNSEKTVEEK